MIFEDEMCTDESETESTSDDDSDPDLDQNNNDCDDIDTDNECDNEDIGSDDDSDVSESLEVKNKVACYGSKADMNNDISNLNPILFIDQKKPSKLQAVLKKKLKDSEPSIEIRNEGKHSLSSILGSQKNVQIFETCVFNKTSTSIELYKNMVYEVCSMIASVGLKNINKVLCLLKTDKLQWNSEEFSKIYTQLAEQDEFLQNPIEVEEGIFTCRCGSKRTISFSLQTRSGDEATTVFVSCISCNRKWKAN